MKRLFLLTGITIITLIFCANVYAEKWPPEDTTVLVFKQQGNKKVVVDFDFEYVITQGRRSYIPVNQHKKLPGWRLDNVRLVFNILDAFEAKTGKLVEYHTIEKNEGDTGKYDAFYGIWVYHGPMMIK